MRPDEIIPGTASDTLLGVVEVSFDAAGHLLGDGGKQPVASHGVTLSPRLAEAEPPSADDFTVVKKEVML